MQIVSKMANIFLKGHDAPDGLPVQVLLNENE